MRATTGNRPHRPQEARFGILKEITNTSYETQRQPNGWEGTSHDERRIFFLKAHEKGNVLIQRELSRATTHQLINCLKRQQGVHYDVRQMSVRAARLSFYRLLTRHLLPPGLGSVTRAHHPVRHLALPHAALRACGCSVATAVGADNAFDPLWSRSSSETTPSTTSTAGGAPPTGLRPMFSTLAHYLSSPPRPTAGLPPPPYYQPPPPHSPAGLSTTPATPASGC